MATGSVVGSGLNSSNVLKVIGGAGGSRPATPEFVSWPPPGFVPYQILPASSHRWSISIDGADFSQASVSMTKASVAVATTRLQPVSLTYGDNTLVWEVAGISYGRPTQDESYVVSVSNVRIGTLTRTFNYMVTVIDPAVSTPSVPGNLRIVQ